MLHSHIMSDYQDSAGDYSRRPFGAGTDALAFEALKVRLESLGCTGRAIDIGCGAGRSTRFLKELGFDAVGLDISPAMLKEALRQDMAGTYVPNVSTDSFPFPDESFDLALSTWAVPELATPAALDQFIREAARVLKPHGRLFVVTNRPEFYGHRWVSCEVDFPENRGTLVSGQSVTARLMPEGVVVKDYFWADHDYRNAFASAGLNVADVMCPTAPAGESGWLDETRIAPYIIYELIKS